MNYPLSCIVLDIICVLSADTTHAIHKHHTTTHNTYDTYTTYGTYRTYRTYDTWNTLVGAEADVRKCLQEHLDRSQESATGSPAAQSASGAPRESASSSGGDVREAGLPQRCVCVCVCVCVRDGGSTCCVKATGRSSGDTGGCQF